MATLCTICHLAIANSLLLKFKTAANRRTMAHNLRLKTVSRSFWHWQRAGPFGRQLDASNFSNFCISVNKPG